MIDHINHANPPNIILREHNDIFSTPGYIFLAYPQELRYGASEDRACALRYSDLIPNARLKAFSGEFLETEAEIARTEGRDYETAEVLLKKIKEERMKSGKTTNVILWNLLFCVILTHASLLNFNTKWKVLNLIPCPRPDHSGK